MQNIVRNAWLLGMGGCLLAGAAALPGAAADQPFAVRASQASAFEDDISASIAKAKETLDDAVARYYAGMQGKAKFYCTIRLADDGGRVEQVFVEVANWGGGRIAGHISNTLRHLQGYVKGQEVAFDQADVLDWTIRHADGREEGNFIGRFLREERARRAAAQQ
ncbi:MAG: DUF2314 domain-containing protein [Planctomycetes bacterium]|nr:DUF2314 domain-containing protein [Planctomycetota bacterium]